MATNINFINYTCEQLNGMGKLTYKKIFGEYMLYINDKPIIIVCDNTAYIKKLECIKELMKSESTGYPYDGAKEHYILDIDDKEFIKKVIMEVEKVTKIPKKKTK